MTDTASLNRVDTTLASAGTGKTTALVRHLADAIDSGISPDRILGTTFTSKAADELVERARSHLIGLGRLDEATQLLGARLGTINAVCGRLVSEFAFELGRSPANEVIPEESADAIFAVAADETIARFAPELNDLAELFGLPDQDVDWRTQVRRIIELARANGIAADAFGHSAEQSIASLLALLPDPAPGGEKELDAALRREVDRACQAIQGVPLKATSAGAAEALKATARILERGDQLPWPLWARLSKPGTAKANEAYFAGAAAAALVHPRHPRLRRDLERFVRQSFACAAQCLSAYQDYKAERGLLDFVDQEALALEVLRRPDTQERLRERIGIVLIDEVQDASPLQVAIFTELARIAPRSVWVGDPKQSIYAFRSTDSNLTLAASQDIAKGTGGTAGVLSKSWRSRPGICSFVNDAFVPAFAAMGLPEDSSRFTDWACDDAGLTTPPLAVWHVEGKNKGEHALNLAGGIVNSLANPDAWPVRDRSGIRGLRPGDIAVLCRGNGDAEDVASALSALGVPVAVDRGDLFKAAEVELVMAAMRWTADRTDRLALAEVARMIGGTTDSDAWLEAVLADEPDTALKALVPFAPALEILRDQQLGMTPCEMVDAVIMATGVIDLACRWGDASERVHQLEAFRGVACSYEEACSRLRSPATLGGMIAWLKEQTVSQPKSLDGNAVQVMTYHKAKGLEWPVVVLAQLNKGAWTNLFRPVIEVDGEIDWRNPLARRWIRLWPWPYGKQSKGVHLDTTAPASPIGRRAERQARQEAVRLLYVGATRARDHLILSKVGSRPTAWLDELNTSAASHVVLPTRSGDPLLVGGRPHAVRYQVVRQSNAAPASPEQLFLAVERSRRTWRPLRLQPSTAAGGAIFVRANRTELGGRIPITGSPEMDVLGQAVHAFLAVDRRDGDRAARLAKARFVLDRWAVSGHMVPDDLLGAADRLWTFVRNRFPGARLRREVPAYATLGSQVVTGRIDLLVEGDGFFAVIDHKSFPGREKLWDERAIAYGPQLDLYARAVATATGRACSGLFVHLPIVGTIIEVQYEDALNIGAAEEPLCR